MFYDPFQRGTYSVGVRTIALVDAARNRRLAIEIWYPAVDACAGLDMAKQTCDRYQLMPCVPSTRQLALRDAPLRPGTFPLVVFSHGFGGHRRQSTFFCTHVASHGYVVAAMDHTGNTVADLIAARARPLARSRRGSSRAMIEDRPRDIRFVVDQFLGQFLGQLPGKPVGQRPGTRLPGGDDISAAIAGKPIALVGHSFGGFTALATLGSHSGVRAAIALAPAGGETPAGGQALQRYIDFERTERIPTLVIAGSEDSVLPIAGIRSLYQRLPGQKQLVVVEGADHFHFCDDGQRIHQLFRLLPPFVPIARRFPPFSRLGPIAQAYQVIRGLGVAHLDAFVAGRSDAEAFLASDLRALFAGRGIPITVA